MGTISGDRLSDGMRQAHRPQVLMLVQCHRGPACIYFNNEYIHQEKALAIKCDNLALSLFSLSFL
jgi:hypothetical protein